MHNLSIFMIALLAPAALAAQETSAPGHLAFEGENWRVTAQEAAVETRLGRQALKLQAGRVWLDDADFADGVISFDASYDGDQLFAGAGWRGARDDYFEMMYFRGHLHEVPDGLQYTPVENGFSAWQIFTDDNSIAPVSHNYDGWNKVKLVIEGDKLDIYFNGALALHVPDQKTDLKRGVVSLGASGAGTVYLSNIEIRPLKEGEHVVGTPKETPELPEGVIESWDVSAPFAEADVADVLTLANNAGDRDWKTLAVETNGIANISRITEYGENADTVFIRLNIKSNSRQVKDMRFGFSDRARIYLNGKRIFAGDDGYRTRDYRFLGTMGFYDSVGLDLKKGENEVLIAVSETFGGWGWTGAIKDRSGITLGD